ncbi:MAG: HAMP domain-containing sensor histidine kinase [Bacteroidota bacterium]
MRIFSMFLCLLWLGGMHLLPEIRAQHADSTHQALTKPDSTESKVVQEGDLPFLFSLLCVTLIGVLGLLVGYYRHQLDAHKRAAADLLAQKREQYLKEFDQLTARFTSDMVRIFHASFPANQRRKAGEGELNPVGRMVDTGRADYRLWDQVQQVIELSRYESGNVSLDCCIIDLVSFLEEIKRSFEPLAAGKEQHLHFSYQLDSLLVNIDPQKLERVLFNLLSYALSCSPRKGSISVKLQMIAHRVHIGVKDSGQRIPKECLPYLFDRFYEGGWKGKRMEVQSRIGLALVKALVEMHDGEISVYSDGKRGGEFWLELPMTAGIDSSPVPYQHRLKPICE